MSSVVADSVLEKLFQESQEVGRRITSHLLAGDQVITVGATIVGAAFALAYRDSLTYVLVPTPLFLATIGMYGINLYAEVNTLSGYKAALELELNRRAGFPITFWDSDMADLRRASLVTKANRVLYALVFAVIVFATLWAVRGNAWLFAGALGISAVSAGAIVAGFWDQARAFRRARDRAIERLASARTGGLGSHGV